MKKSFKIQDPLVPKGMKVVEEEGMPSTLYQDFFCLAELSEIDGPLIRVRDCINTSAGILDFFKENKEIAIAILKQYRPIYAMGTLYNKENESDDVEDAWVRVRSIDFDAREEAFVESDWHLFYQEFYGGYALMYNIKKHKAYETNKKATEEMAKLSLSKGKTIKVLFTEPPERHELKEHWPDGYVGPVANISEWKAISFVVPIKVGSKNLVFPFIDAEVGITKIILEDTGEILYENSELFYPPKMNAEQKLSHMNKQREKKFGTDQYRAWSLS